MTVPQDVQQFIGHTTLDSEGTGVTENVSTTVPVSHEEVRVERDAGR